MNQSRVGMGIIVLLSIFLNYSPTLAQHEGHQTEEKEREQKTIWTCSMHPQIKLPKPGKCPICSMDLIPVVSGGASMGSEHDGPRLELSSTARMLAEVETSRVERRAVEREVRLVGKVDYDETRLKHITAWVAGRIDRLYVDYTGIRVKEGDHMVYLYSPSLLSAQEELIQASRAVQRLGKGGSSMIERSTRRSAEAAREKLRLLGLTESQVKSIERKATADEHITIYAPMGGVVVEKHVNEGIYVQTGTKVYTIADLSHLWVNLDAYESDLPWIRYGQVVEFTAEAFPGKRFKGIVSFVQPFLNEKTRTVKVRVNVENEDEALKPGLFVTATIRSKISADGTVLGPSFAGQYICPMHPEVVRDESGNCPVCGMSLERAESLPFVPEVHSHAHEPPLVVPASAPLITGKRAIVYVAGEQTGSYEGREIVLGPRAGTYYVVLEGLQEGERVVTEGAFKLDADLQIRGEVSMMNPEGVAQSEGHSHGDSGNKKMKADPHAGHKMNAPKSAAKKTLGEKESSVLKGYLQLSGALADDDLPKAKEALSVIETAAQALNVGEIGEIFKKHESSVTDTEAARRIFGELSVFLLPRLEEYNIPAEQSVYKAYCPMALDGKGAEWLQRGKEIKNPYFGKAMLSCGELRGEL